MNTLKPNIQYFPQWLDQQQADHLFDQLLLLPWQEEVLHMYGRQVTVPRKVLWYAENQLNYRYAGKDHIGLPLPKSLVDVQHKLAAMGFAFNSCLANLYHHGDDYMGWHSDNEKCLGEHPIIASISLGAARDFHFKHKQTQHVYKMQLQHGDLLMMLGDTQQQWQHCLPKRKRVLDKRINLTFRQMLTDKSW